MTKHVKKKTNAEKSTVRVVVAEGVFHFHGLHPDGSAKWHFVANADEKRKKPPRRFMGLLYRKDQAEPPTPA